MKYIADPVIANQVIHDLTDGISGTLQKGQHERLIELLREVRDRGLIYWEPQTTRGHIAKADMLARIDLALSSQNSNTPPPDCGKPQENADG